MYAGFGCSGQARCCHRWHVVTLHSHVIIVHGCQLDIEIMLHTFTHKLLSWIKLKCFVLRKPGSPSFSSKMVVTALTMAFSYFCRCHPVLEQPLGSCMPKEEPLKSVLSAIGASKTLVYHGAYSHETQKPLQLWSPADLQSLTRPRPSNLSSDLVIIGVKTDKNGFVLYDSKGRPIKTWTGIKSKMSGSQTYSCSFGRAVAKELLKWQGKEWRRPWFGVIHQICRR